MTWGEAVRQTRTLRVDPSTAVAAAIEGWSHPISRECLAVLDLFDLMAWVNSDKKTRSKPHGGRPWKTTNAAERIGNNGGRSRTEVVEILNRLGHKLPVP